MIGRLSILALVVVSVFCSEQHTLDTLRAAGANRVAVLGLEGFLRASENYNLPQQDGKAIANAFANPSDALSDGLEVYKKHINVEKADEQFIEGSFSGHKFCAINTKHVIVASVWPENNANAEAEMRSLAEYLDEHY